jgi:hypothetical protein
MLLWHISPAIAQVHSKQFSIFIIYTAALKPVYAAAVQLKTANGTGLS